MPVLQAKKRDPEELSDLLKVMQVVRELEFARRIWIFVFFYSVSQAIGANRQPITGKGTVGKALPPQGNTPNRGCSDQ